MLLSRTLCPLILLLLFVLTNVSAGSSTQIRTESVTFSEPVTTELRLREYAVIPSPREVTLGAEEIELDQTWGCRGVAIGNDHIAFETLRDDLETFHPGRSQYSSSRPFPMGPETPGVCPPAF